MTANEKIWWDDLLARDQRSKRRRALRARLWIFLRPGLVVGAVAMAVYFGMFCYRFEVLGDPVIGKRGWEGPYMRGDRHPVDAGKVGVYEGTDYSLYDLYSPMCHIWIFCNGLDYHGR